MVCCGLLAALLGLMLRLRAWRSHSALMWRPFSEPGTHFDATAARRGTRLQSFAYALDGLGYVFRNEPNMRVHGGAALFASASGWLVGLTLEEWRWLALAIALVFTAEAFNTAVERACDAVSMDYSAAIKAAKDVAAGAVLICAITAATIGASIFAPHLHLGASTHR